MQFDYLGVAAMSDWKIYRVMKEYANHDTATINVNGHDFTAKQLRDNFATCVDVATTRNVDGEVGELLGILAAFLDDVDEVYPDDLRSEMRRVAERGANVCPGAEVVE